MESLDSFVADQVPCRHVEANRILKSLTECVENKHSGSMYIAGYPGTGKTYTLRIIVNNLKKFYRNLTVVYINCMSFDTPKALYRELCEQLNVRMSRSSTALEIFESNLKRRNSPLLICLDEIDRLVGTDGSVLYSAFSWPTICKWLVIVGVANAFDLIERELPKLKVDNCKVPEVVQFSAYTREEVEKILKFRLKSLIASGDDKALELCARKVSATTGDIRAAIDICKMSLHNSPMVQKNADDTESTFDSSAIIRSVNESFNRRFEPHAVALPLQQKLLLATALSLQRKGRKSFTSFSLYKEYSTICKKIKMPILNTSEVRHVCQLLESSGLLSAINKRNEFKLAVEEGRVLTFIKGEKTIMKLLGNVF